MLFIQQPLLYLLVAVGSVNAGSRAWEPRIRHAKAAIAARDLSGVNDIYLNRTNAFSGHPPHQKRAFGVGYPANSGSWPRLWPNGNIDACFEQRSHLHGGQNKHTRDILYDDLIAARELWRSNGLDDKNGQFRFNILGDNDPRCERSQRSSHLFIMYAGEGVQRMSTTVGFDQARSEPDSDAPDSDLGCTMVLSDLEDMGMENVVANYAHEMGVSKRILLPLVASHSYLRLQHAWGLFHEHQNPKWWDATFTRVTRERVFFSEENFHCENLADFDKVMEPFANIDPLDRRKIRNELCRDRVEASNSGFGGGYNYIPVTDVPGTMDDGHNEPDWESLMLCKSP